VDLGERPGALAEVTRVLADIDLTITGIVTLRGRDGGREAVVRVATEDPRAAVRALAQAGYRVRDGERLAAGA
jgi:hypothetical protein